MPNVGISHPECVVQKIQASSNYPTLIATLKGVLGEEILSRKPSLEMTGPGADYCDTKAVEEARAIIDRLRASSAASHVGILRDGLRQAEINESVHRAECF